MIHLLNHSRGSYITSFFECLNGTVVRPLPRCEVLQAGENTRVRARPREARVLARTLGEKAIRL